MLPERLKKGYWLVKDEKTAWRILRVKKHPEYSEERLYILEGDYGTKTKPFELQELDSMGYSTYVSNDKLNDMIKEGKYFPSKGKARIKK